MHERVTLLRPEALRPDARGISSALPPDLLGQSAERLRILALLYAFAFFMAGIFPMLVVPASCRPGRAGRWWPPWPRSARSPSSSGS
jgi:hypothetical protein